MNNIKVIRNLLEEINNMGFSERMFFDLILEKDSDLVYEEIVAKELLEIYELNGDSIPDWVNIYLNTPDKEKARIEAVEDFIATFLALNEEDH